MVKSLWGVTQAMGNCGKGYESLFTRIAADGFQAVETPIWVIKDKVAFAQALDKTGMEAVIMINTCTPENLPGSHSLSRKVQEHIKSFKRQVDEALALSPRVLFVNSHSGVDAWSQQDTHTFFKEVLSYEAEVGKMILHETHRGRCLYNPWVTRDLCRAFSSLKLTADLSHFCVVAERIFDDDKEEDWQEVLSVVAPATRHIHARVGYSQGPQVNDPRAPEHAATLAAHEKWWDAILLAQSDRIRATGEKVGVVTLEPEHGTDGYQQMLPYTQAEVSDIWTINKWLRDRQVRRLLSKPFIARDK